MQISKTLKTYFITLLVIITFAASICVQPSFIENAEAQTTIGESPKYVFYFIGDGLGSAQRQAAEYFLQEKEKNPAKKLTMNLLPVAGINTTHSLDTLVTDSAAAGTALATGHKTDNGIISKLPDGTDVKSLIECAEEQGMGTGIITTTRITHATPAVFASHNMDRNDENGIAADYVDSGVDFIVGGGARHFLPEGWADAQKDGIGSTISSKRKDDRNLIAEFSNQGYITFYGEAGCEEFKNYTPSSAEKVFAVFTNSHISYEIDRINKSYNVPSISEMTEKGIDVLSKYPEGFFMMVEGGRIDHACHANDAAGSIHDTIAFDEAIKEALDFYNEHPNETLIVVAGDHETGGMGLGFSKNYFLNMDELINVKVSVEDTLQNVYNGNRTGYFDYIKQNMNLSDLTEAEKAEITNAMKVVDSGADVGAAYGSYDPVAIATTHVLSQRANLYWTTYAHSGTAIPMSAIGIAAQEFAGYKDNTEIAKAMANVMNFELTK